MLDTLFFWIMDLLSFVGHTVDTNSKKNVLVINAIIVQTLELLTLVCSCRPLDFHGPPKMLSLVSFKIKICKLRTYKSYQIGFKV